MILRKYGVGTTILFPLIDRGAADFESTPVTHAAGDTQISKDEGAFANTSNAFAHEGNGVYSLVLTTTEMEAARIVVTIIDQTSPKAWEDQCILIESYSHASAQHPIVADIADAICDEALAGHTTAGTLGKAIGDLPVAAGIADAVCDEALAGHTIAGTLGKAIGDLPSGIGTVAVDHNFGGTDALRYVDGAGSGIDNADILIYLKSDYDSGNLAADYVKAKTSTDVNGRWANSCYLDPATYTVQVYKQGEFGPDTQEITVT